MESSASNAESSGERITVTDFIPCVFVLMLFYHESLSYGGTFNEKPKHKFDLDLQRTSSSHQNVATKAKFSAGCGNPMVVPGGKTLWINSKWEYALYETLPYSLKSLSEICENGDVKNPSSELLHQILSNAVGKSFLFVGNSHLRTLVVAFLQLFGGNTTAIETVRHGSHEYFLNKSNIRVTFLWSTFGWINAIKSYFTFFDEADRTSSGLCLFNRSAPLLFRINPAHFDVVVVNSGAWHMLYRDTDPFLYVSTLQMEFKLLSEMFPDAALYFMNLNKFYPPDTSYVNRTKAEQLLHCFSESRQHLYRALHYCAAYRFNAENQENGISQTSVPFDTSYPRLLNTIWMIDTYPITSLIQNAEVKFSENGSKLLQDRPRPVLLSDGHHYGAEVNNLLIRVLLKSFLSMNFTSVNEDKRDFVQLQQENIFQELVINKHFDFLNTTSTDWCFTLQTKTRQTTSRYEIDPICSAMGSVSGASDYSLPTSFPTFSRWNTSQIYNTSSEHLEDGVNPSSVHCHTLYV